MLDWCTATDVFVVRAGTRRFLNPLLDGETPPFPAYVESPTGERLSEPPTLPALVIDPDNPVAALAGRPAPTGLAVPEFSRVDRRSLVRVHAAGVADRYGFGEVCGSLRHDNRRITGSTRDSFAYDDRTDQLYQSHPWGVCVRADGSAFGVIIETTYAFTAHIYDHLLIETDGPPPAVTIIEGDDVPAVLRGLHALTGAMPMPPKWALGFQQSRWSYEPAAQVLEIAQEFRDRKLPADVIWVDIDYMDRFKVFTFDPEGFPDPGGLVDDLHAIGWKSAWMIDPGVKVEEGYSVYDEAQAGGHLLADRDGTETHGIVWPGVTAFPDFTRAATRAWWAGLYEPFLRHGLDAVWNDMNEPANLEDVPEKALPGDTQHDADEALGGPGDHDRYKNVYGLLMTEASRAGMVAARPDERPFLLTRSTFLGGHRYAATWTGDNVSSWEHLAWSIPMALNLGLSGQPMAGPDIGGFAGRCEATLLARWMGIGCLFPFARNHNMKTMPPQEPWAFGAAVEATCRRALERRYRLLPYLYTAMYEASVTGVPLMRPAFFADPRDRSLRGEDTAFLLGPDLFVRCDVSQDRRGARASVPVGWRRIEVIPGESKDPDLPELYLRPGAVLPLGPVMQFTDELPLDEVELIVHLDPAGTAVGRLYEDDGHTTAYLDGAFRLTSIAVMGDQVEITQDAGALSASTWSTTRRDVGPR